MSAHENDDTAQTIAHLIAERDEADRRAGAAERLCAGLRMALNKAREDAQQQRQQKSSFVSSGESDRQRRMETALSLKAHTDRTRRQQIATELYREYQEAWAGCDDVESRTVCEGSRAACRVIKNLASALGVWDEFAAMDDNPPEPDPNPVVPIETVAEVNDAFSALSAAMAKFPKAEV